MLKALHFGISERLCEGPSLLLPRYCLSLIQQGKQPFSADPVPGAKASSRLSHWHRNTTGSFRPIFSQYTRHFWEVL